MRKSNSNLARLKITGTNTNSIINYCVANNIQIKDIYKENSKEIELSISDKDLQKLLKLDLANYEVSYLSSTIRQKFVHFLVYRIGLIVGILLSIIFMFFMQNRLININIYGLNNIDNNEVIEKINEYGIKRFSLMNFNKTDLEKYLAENFNLSFVSIMTNGNTLIISAKEELPDITKSYEPITAEYNMVITQINVYSGTSTKKVGDVVFAGDILVEPYEIINDNKIEIAPCAEIKADVFYSDSYNYVENEEMKVRTGNSQIVSIEMNLGKYKILNNNYECKFENYEIINCDNLITQYFLPIHINKIIAYETKMQTITHNFEEEKDAIIENLKKSVYSKVPSNIKIKSEDIKINSTNYGNIITIYLKSSVYLKYNSN